MQDPETEPTKPWAGTSARYGSIGDTGEWKAAIEEYYWDRLDSAHSLALRLGVGAGGWYEGWYRKIEAEAVTRHRSEQAKAADWLTLEWISEETEGADYLGPLALDACQDVARRLGFDVGAKTMISILAIESDAPWAVGRYGYMIDKYPYDKICIPNAALSSVHEYQEVISHEFAHVVVHNLTEGNSPHWLHEAVAMLVERRTDLQLRRAFASGRAEWLGARELEITHSRNRQGEPDQARTWRAYQQSAWIGRYLAEIGGEAKVGEFLRGFADNSAWSELKMRVTGQTHADEALRQTYGFGEKELFEKTLTWIRGAGDPPAK